MQGTTFCLFLAFCSFVICQSCESDGIVVGRTLLDSTVKQYFFATEDQQDIYILTHAGTVYRSTDGALTWINVISEFPQYDNSTISATNNIGVRKLHGTGLEGIVYFEGHGFAYWVTRGDGEYKLHTTGYKGADNSLHGDYIYEIRAHPTLSNYVMRIVWDSECFASDYEVCFHRTDVSSFQGLDSTWVVINYYTFKAEWGGREDQLFIITMIDDRPDNILDVPSLEPNKVLESLSNFGMEVEVTIPHCIEFSFINGVVYFVKYTGLGSVRLYVSTDIHTANEMVFGGNPEFSGISFAILPTSTDVSMISVKSQSGVVYGTLFQGAATEPNYWRSLDHIRLPGTGPDFYQTLDLPGIYLANSYKTEGEHVTGEIATKITFNEGAIWRDVVDENEDPLHLFLTNEYTQQGPHSDEKAPGIIYAHGNVGTAQEPTEDDIAIYLSRSGGFYWEKVLDGTHFFTFNDHASLAVAIPSPNVTNTLTYTWDQGLSWESCIWGMDGFYVRALHPITNAGLQFFVIGEYPNGQGAILYLDFQDNNPLICDYSDFEPFSASVGNSCLLGSADIFMRRLRESTCVVTDVGPYVLVDGSACECSRLDYQCDGSCFGEVHVDGQVTSICVNLCEGLENDPTLPPEECEETYMMTQGYRKIPGDSCQGGESADFEPIEMFCPGFVPSSSPTSSSSPSSSPTSSASPSGSVAPKSSSETPSPTLSVKGDDGDVSVSPSISASSVPSVSVSISISTSATPSLSASTSVSRSVGSSASTSPSTSPSVSETSSMTMIPSVVPSMSPSISSTISTSVVEIIDPASSGITTITFSDATPESPEAASPGSPEDSSNGDKDEDDDSYLIYVYVGSAVAGIVLFCLLVFICVVIVVCIKKGRGGYKKAATKPDDDDLFSLEDNDEWEL